jgi:hypothetical protein
MTGNQIPPQVLHGLMQIPAFAEKVHIRKIYRGEGVSKAAAPTPARKLSYAEILRGSSARNLGTPPPAVPKAKPNTTENTRAAINATTPEQFAPLPRTSLGARGSNTPKVPANPSNFPSALTMREIDERIAHAMEDADTRVRREAFERMNARKSAFSRISPTQPHQVTRSGSGNVWGLRNLGGAIAAAVLGGTTQKGEREQLPATSAWRPMSGASLKG